VDNSLARSDFGQTARLLTKIQVEYDVMIDDLTKDERYVEFVKSPEYAEWIKQD
jgi:hypothetical protein